MVVPVLIYLAINAGHSSSHGWGTAMSTDTAFALGLLALVGSGLPDRLRAYLLTVAVVDDIVALLVIAIAYSGSSRWFRSSSRSPSSAASCSSARPTSTSGSSTSCSVPAVWVAFYESGVDPVVAGLMGGVIALAYPAQRTRPRARDATSSASSASSRRESCRGRRGRHCGRPSRRTNGCSRSGIPGRATLIVPLFALANAGVHLSAGFLSTAFTSPVTLGIMFGYVLGKPIGIVGATWLATKVSHGRLRPPVGWASVLGAGTLAGIGFTVSILIADLAFHGAELDEAKVGTLSAALLAATLTWLVVLVTKRLPRRLRIRALLGAPDLIVDLAEPVDPERDHIRGSLDAPVTVLEYGDFECPYCGQAEPVLRELLREHGDVAYVWRHLPLNDVHPNAQRRPRRRRRPRNRARSGRCTTCCSRARTRLGYRDLVGYAGELGLDVERFEDDLRTRAERRAHRGGRRLRRSLGRHGHADLLRQRAAPLRRVRHRDALRSGEGRASARVRAGVGLPASDGTVWISSAPRLRRVNGVGAAQRRPTSCSGATR